MAARSKEAPATFTTASQHRRQSSSKPWQRVSAACTPHTSSTHARGLRRALHPAPRQTSERDPTLRRRSSCDAYRCSSAAARMAPRMQPAMRHLPRRKKAPKRAATCSPSPSSSQAVTAQRPAPRSAASATGNITQAANTRGCMRVQCLPRRLESRRAVQASATQGCLVRWQLPTGRAHCATSAHIS